MKLVQILRLRLCFLGRVVILSLHVLLRNHEDLSSVAMSCASEPTLVSTESGATWPQKHFQSKRKIINMKCVWGTKKKGVSRLGCSAFIEQTI